MIARTALSRALPRAAASSTSCRAAAASRVAIPRTAAAALSTSTALASSNSSRTNPLRTAASSISNALSGALDASSPALTEFDPHAVTAMDKQEPPAPGADFNVVIVGAGNINFGEMTTVPTAMTAAARAELTFPCLQALTKVHGTTVSVSSSDKLGPRLKVTALIDPSAARANKVLGVKRNSFVLSAYKDTVVYPNIEAYFKNLDPAKKPHAIWVGSPPAFRGQEREGRDLEKKLIEYFPDVALFIEKPVSTGPVEEAFSIAEKLKKAGTTASVGYMLRYLKVVQKMKQILEENNLKVMATNARYIMAYEHTAKPDWWDKSQTCGPIVEQATHFCDLSRYFGGEVDLSTVMAHSLEHFEPAGKLSRMPIDESKIPAEQRIPRITCATWKYESGAVGSLTHAVALQGHNYSTELDVYADGYQLRLVDPYNAPVLYFRRPGDDHEEVVRYQNDDPFFSEVANLIDVIENGPGAAPLLSTYEDAAKTYALTWAIRLASEKSAKKPE
ncbi:hypothetical protein OC842_006552 [Tilletia horrida]|uniref:Gfo/Idh/MocA-like oxidoreductase N-terminal domain-containing protein n=1 Tax=Tilletia horrida TaxID=155126 RepID=A0AAN6JHY5_9BASI|nr:hypothetical protein OC842_006552 [Tilletia horrida]